MLFDQAIFQQQRVSFRWRNQPFNVMDLGDEQPSLAVLVLLCKVARDALLEVLGFTNVQKPLIRIEVLVHAWLMRQACEGVFYVLRFSHCCCEFRADYPTNFGPWFLLRVERVWSGAIWWTNC